MPLNHFTMEFKGPYYQKCVHTQSSRARYARDPEHDIQVWIERCVEYYDYICERDKYEEDKADVLDLRISFV